MAWPSGVGLLPRVVNAISVEPTKPRLILSMRAVNLFCRDAKFALTLLSEIAQHVPKNSFFTGLDDTGDTSICSSPQNRILVVLGGPGIGFMGVSTPFFQESLEKMGRLKGSLP